MQDMRLQQGPAAFSDLLLISESKKLAYGTRRLAVRTYTPFCFIAGRKGMLTGMVVFEA